MKIGQSTDIHRLVEGRRLVIGGVEIPFEKGGLGHSDADALTHAITEAIIGAMALGDIGKFFPDNDPATEGINSQILLKKVADMMYENGYEIGNIDSLIIIEKPKMRPFIDAMRKTLSGTIGCPMECVNVKATCAEGMGPIGEGKAYLAQAVVLLNEVKKG